ncbi:sulfite exporter TauE/SafE family protein [Caldisalinibacter kiritimatiensis]|uniref:Probable membrane transporter protein n=1 Tax=Caldisalinibacter kiritimatiensis TaxID=1304284 RepID=R1CHM0_9FIRM|nr:sulfite exporter TauE/SafE family protein [Caldisalinibacter kiritimatiensis]EOD01795.1 protein of unknown function DUF81 [Caldisalinibacter kiritimatiensis]
MEFLNFFYVLLAGIVSGFLNVNAGGGSLISMPLLIFLGLPSAVANGTNRVALMVQNIIAITNFREKGYFDWKIGVMLAAPAIVGSIVGSSIAVSLSDEIFNKILGVMMLVILVLIIWQPQKKLKIDPEQELSTKRKIIGIIIFFFVGIYGGMIQGGVGFIIITSLMLLTGYSLVRINSLKVFIVAIYMLVSLIIFIVNGKVNWMYGFILAIGNGLGAYLGSNFAVKKGDKWIKVVLVVAIVVMAIKLFLGL